MWEPLKICVDPSTSVGEAVLLFHDKFQERYLEHVDRNDSNNPDKKRIVNASMVLCGGNVDMFAMVANMGSILSPA